MPESKKAKLNFRHCDVCERDWHPRVCIKMTSLHKMWLRRLLMTLVKRRVDTGPVVSVTIDEDDFLYLVEIIGHFDNARFIKSSIDPLTSYGGSDSSSTI